MLNNFGEKKNLFLLSKQTFLTVPQISFFQRGLTHAFGKKKCFCFHYLFSPKMRLELRFNNILKRKQALFFRLCKLPRIAFFQRGKPML